MSAVVYSLLVAARYLLVNLTIERGKIYSMKKRCKDRILPFRDEVKDQLDWKIAVEETYVEQTPLRRHTLASDAFSEGKVDILRVREGPYLLDQCSIV